MRPNCKSKCVCIFATCICITVLPYIAYFAGASARYLEGLIPMEKCFKTVRGEFPTQMENSIDGALDLWSREDVQTCTYWGAPIIWDGLFDPDYYDGEHKRMGSSVAVTVFAVGRYLEAYLEAFLLSAEKHFMNALPVTYYVFTDVPKGVPVVQLAPGRSLKVVVVPRHSRWQDISMMRMSTIADTIETDIRHHHSHVFCFDVDQVFAGRFGSEALGESVALLHAYYYHRPKVMYTYDRNPKSAAYLEDGDFYYHAAVFGGTWQGVKRLTEACYKSIMDDKDRGVEALWHDESHLNKYLWLHKPTKVLSPEYCWDEAIGPRSDIHITRLLWAEKQYSSLRDG